MIILLLDEDSLRAAHTALLSACLAVAHLGGSLILSVRPRGRYRPRHARRRQTATERAGLKRRAGTARHAR